MGQPSAWWWKRRREAKKGFRVWYECECGSIRLCITLTMDVVLSEGIWWGKISQNSSYDLPKKQLFQHKQKCKFWYRTKRVRKELQSKEWNVWHSNLQFKVIRACKLLRGFEARTVVRVEKCGDIKVHAVVELRKSRKPAICALLELENL